MRLILKKRSGKFLDSLEVPDECTVEQFKQTFYDKYHYYPERQWWTVDDPRGEPLRGEGSLSNYKVYDNTTLYFKDLGVQISWRLVFVLEYLGPLLIFPSFYFFPNIFYGTPAPQRCLTQIICLWLLMFHFIKRELETLFVHRFSNSTMPVVRVPLNCGHYWMLCGVFIGYYLFHPKYRPLWEPSYIHVVYILATLMLICEFLNFKTHVILRNLRSRGTRQRGIPHGYGFDTIACANYLWEILAWLSFSILASTLTAWVFFAVGSLQMTEWALKKLRNYRAEFKDFPRNRKALIPYVL